MLERLRAERHAGPMLASSFRWSLPISAALALAMNFGVTACDSGESSDDAGGAAGSGGRSSGGAGGTSGSSGGAHSGDGGSGATGSGATGPCYDEPCSGNCVGSCAGGWTCETDVGCTSDIQQYCGCDGQTFSGSGSCPQLGYASEGACSDPAAGSVNCDPADITCQPIVPPEPCPEGQVYSVVNNCHGSCVPIDSCACSSAAECPDHDHYTCLNGPGHCSYYLR